MKGGNIFVHDYNHHLYVGTKAEEMQSATPAGSIKIAQNGTHEQKLNLFMLKREIPEEALVYLANNGNKEIIDAILNYRSIHAPVWTAFLTRARENEEIEKLLLEHPKFPERKKSVLHKFDEQSCINCLNRKGLNYDFGCQLGYECDPFSWCDEWKVRTLRENYCMGCYYNNGEKYTKRATNGNWLDKCQYSKRKKIEK